MRWAGARRGRATVRVHVARSLEAVCYVIAVVLFGVGAAWFTLGVLNRGGYFDTADLAMLASVPFWSLARSSAVVLSPAGVRTPTYGFCGRHWSWEIVSEFEVSERQTLLGRIRELRPSGSEPGEYIWSSRVRSDGTSTVDEVVEALGRYLAEMDRSPTQG